MNFEAILKAIENPAIIAAALTAITTALGIAVKISGAIKSVKRDVTDTKASAINMLKQALPKDLTINIEKLARAEFERLTAEIRAFIGEQVLQPIKDNSELVGALAKAIVSIRSIPENLRQEVAELTKEPTVINTTDSIKLELNTELADEQKKETKKVFIV